ncbi:MAG: agmatinase family protein [Candidatus Wallbacteria bacterium]|nr:agmatinase family protein [Candidatus Wallbacteria bacterium]
MSSHEFDPNAAAVPGSGIFGLPFAPEEAALVLVPVPWEATTSYGGGTSEGPAAILDASKQVDLFDLELPSAFRAGIAMLPEQDDFHVWNDEAKHLAAQIIEAGGAQPDDPELGRALERVNELSARVNEAVAALADEWLDAGKVVGVVGGDHSSPLGAIQAVARRTPELGILHLDAHSDTRKAYEGFTYSHASIMENVLRLVPQVTSLVQVGIRDFCQEEFDRMSAHRDRLHVFFDASLAEARFTGTPWGRLVDGMIHELPQDVWLSFDIDGLDPSLCPHTGTPVPGGLSFQEACFLVRAVARSGRRIVGFDLCEVAPGDGPDEWDANVGARLLYKMAIWTLASHGKAEAGS